MPRRLLPFIVLAYSPFAILTISQSQAASQHVAFEVSEGTSLTADISPDGRTVAESLLGQIWLLPATGGKARPVTDTVREPAQDQDPSFSPDGRWIAFTARRPGGRGIFLLPSSGGPLRRLTTGDTYEDPEPAWSPDSSRLVFVLGGALSVVDVARGSTTTIRVDGLKGGPIRHPVWSPDGRRIAFVHGWAPQRLTSPDPGGRVYVVAAEGGNASPLLDADIYALRPAYSPDGRKLAFFVRPAGSIPQIWVADLIGRAQRRVPFEGEVTPVRIRWFPGGRDLLCSANGRLWRVDPNGMVRKEIRFVARVELDREQATLPLIRLAVPGSERPARGMRGLGLSPDGRLIALMAMGKLWVFEPGAQPRALTAIPLDASGLSWSPDSKEVAWCAGPINSEDLFATDISSGCSRRLTELPGRECRPSWSPDGKCIAFIYSETTNVSHDPQRLRIIPAHGETVRNPDSTRDLGQVPNTWHLPTLWFWSEMPQWSPDSGGILMFDKWWMQDRTQGRLIDMSGTSRTLAQFPGAAAHVRWSTGGRLVYVAHNQLWSAPFDSTAGMEGEPVLLWDGPALHPSVARDGTVLFVADDGLRLRLSGGKVQHLGWPLHYRVADAPAPLLIRDVRIVSGRAARNRSDILIRDGRIRRIAPRGTIPPEPGWQTIVGDGRWLIPGLINLAEYLWEPTQMAGALFHGVTTIRDMGAQIGLIADLRDSVEAGQVPGPRIFFVGLQFAPGTDLSGATTSDVYQLTADDSDTARGLALAKGFGASCAYIYQAETLEAGLGLIRLAHRSGLRVTYARLPPLSFIAAGLDSVYGGVLDEMPYGDFTQLLKAPGLSVVAGIAVPSVMKYVYDNPASLAQPDTAPFLTPFLRAWGATRSASRLPFYDAMTAAARRAVVNSYRAGITIAIGEWLPPAPWGIHAEMEELVRSGLSPLDVLKAATCNAARILGVEDDIGTVETDKVADLLLLEADPLADIRNTRRIRTVIQGGRIINRELLRH